MAGSCVFCGVRGPLTGEHVYGKWLSRIGLDLSPTAHGAGPLNRIPRQMGVTSPFRRTVRDVCGQCNSGWMGRLEEVARRVLTPFILGESGTIDASDRGGLAAWAQKTALVAMLVSSEVERSLGYGLPSKEYLELYEHRDSMTPLPTTQMWIGKYVGNERLVSTWVTPLVVAIEDMQELEHPQAYAFTIVIGYLLLHGVGFTASTLEMNLSTQVRLSRLWPNDGAPIVWPGGIPVGDAAFLRLSGGKEIRSEEPHLVLRPWTAATELAESRAVGSMVELDMICGEHVTYYPGALVDEAMRGRFYAFVTSCECGVTYLIETKSDGAHCKGSGTGDAVGRRYAALPGDERIIEDQNRFFFCKVLGAPVDGY
jgi:hypothetical protein